MLPVFVFDDARIYGPNVVPAIGTRGGGRRGDAIATSGGTRKCGPRRAKFVIEAVEDLRRNLINVGSGLIVGVGRTEDVLSDVVRGWMIATSAATARGDGCGGSGRVRVDVICQEEVCSEELEVEGAVMSSLASIVKGGNDDDGDDGDGDGVGDEHGEVHLVKVWGSTLYDPSDLPFDDGVFGMPDTFTPFRNKVEKYCKIGVPLDGPYVDSDNKARRLPKMPDFCARDIGDVDDVDVTAPPPGSSRRRRASSVYVPTLADLGYAPDVVEATNVVDARSAMPTNYRGGETFALSRVEEYIWTKDLLRTYFDTRNGMIGSDYSTKFAPWLSVGNVSPRYIARECRMYEERRIENKSTYWVVFELLWRDYYKFFAMKHGDGIFRLGGTIASSSSSSGDGGGGRRWGMDPRKIRAWKDGMTGYPLVDANMRGKSNRMMIAFVNCEKRGRRSPQNAPKSRVAHAV